MFGIDVCFVTNFGTLLISSIASWDEGGFGGGITSGLGLYFKIGDITIVVSSVLTSPELRGFYWLSEVVGC